MRAVQVVSKGVTRVGQVPMPAVDDGQALVRLHTVGICGTDAGIVSGKIRADLPVILGHEGVGVVEEERGAGVRPGQRVLVDPAVWCGTCDLCLRGRTNICRSGGLIGRDQAGLFADYATVPAARLLPVPDSVSADEAGLLQVLGTCVHALRPVRLFAGDTAVVLGLGVAGQLIVQLLARQGVTVVGVTRSASKRDLAERLGVRSAVAPDAAADTVSGLTAGRGADLVVEAVGTEATLVQAIELAGRAATVVLYGTAPNGGSGLPYYDLYFNELTVWCPRAATPPDYQRAIDLVAGGTVVAEPLVSARFDLDDADRALAEAAKPGSLKVLMTAV